MTYPTRQNHMLPIGSWISDDERAKLELKAQLLSSLLATIHGDGGHHEVERGTEKAVADATSRVVNTKFRLDEPESVMSCGHAARYLSDTIMNDDGSWLCYKCYYYDELKRHEQMLEAKSRIQMLEAMLGEYDMDDVNKELADARSVSEKYNALEAVMPHCGHKARYVVSADEGTSYCLMCEYAARQMRVFYDESKSTPTNQLRNALVYIENRSDAYAVCKKGTCPECDLLYEICDVARKSLGLTHYARRATLKNKKRSR